MLSESIVLMSCPAVDRKSRTNAKCKNTNCVQFGTGLLPIYLAVGKFYRSDD